MRPSVTFTNEQTSKRTSVVWLSSRKQRVQINVCSLASNEELCCLKINHTPPRCNLKRHSEQCSRDRKWIVRPPFFRGIASTVLRDCFKLFKRPVPTYNSRVSGSEIERRLLSTIRDPTLAPERPDSSAPRSSRSCSSTSAQTASSAPFCWIRKPTIVTNRGNPPHSLATSRAAAKSTSRAPWTCTAQTKHAHKPRGKCNRALSQRASQG